jgi:hypothetical protein
VFVPRTSSTLVATLFWQTEGRSANRVFWGSDRASSSCWTFNLVREEFLSAPIHSPLSGRLIWSFRKFFGLCYKMEFISRWSLLNDDPNYVHKIKANF